MPADPERTADALLAWFRGRSRDVPWREESDPYRVWVAEVMAQQTRISTVREYYAPFLDRFPDVEALAAADPDDLMKAWEGLGYYARAHRLRAAARELVAEHGGTLPRTAEELRELPGIGPYTAGAIASIAFGRAEPAVDGNTRRVLSRLYDLAEPTRSALEERARELLSARPGEAGELNQALMDLGGAVCVPRAPECGTCPVGDACLARARGTVADRPPRRPSRELPHRDIAVGLVRREGRLLIARRPEEGLLGGLWEFPGGKVEEDESPPEAVRRELREEMSLEVAVGDLAGRVDHAYSHFRITLHAYFAHHLAGTPRARAATAWRWVTPAELGDYAFPAANTRILEKLREDADGTPGLVGGGEMPGGGRSDAAG